MKLYISVFAIAFIAGCGYFFGTQPTNEVCACDYQQPTPTVEVTPEVTPEITVEPTQEVEPSITPEVTQEPVVVDSTPPQAGSSAQPSNPGTPVCTVPIDAPILQGFEKTSDTSVFWKWWASKSQISKQWIEYGYAKNNYPYSVFVPTNATGFEIGSLQPGLVRWARIGVMNEQGCVAYSEPLDP